MKALRRVIQYCFERRYDWFDSQRALKVLAVVQRQLDARTPRRIWREAEVYAVKVLGSRRFAPWLAVYSTISGKFREGWIPDNFYGRVVSPNINHPIRHVADMKTFSCAIFRSDAIPDAGYVINGTFYDAERRLVSHNQAAEALFQRAEVLIFKGDRSRQGMSVVKLSRDQFHAVNHVHEHGDGVFQRQITQHPQFDQINPGSSTTIRVTTVRNKQGLHEARAAYLRFAGTGEAFVRSATHVRVAIDLTNGETANVGYLSDWSTVDRHPGSSVGFKDFSIPAFDRAVRLCLSLHATLPHAGAIGWDIMVDVDTQVWLLEWNARHNDVKFSEATSGPCFTGLGWEKLRPVRGTWLL